MKKTKNKTKNEPNNKPSDNFLRNVKNNQPLNKDDYKKSFKHRIILKPSQKVFINQCLGHSRFVYNKALALYLTEKNKGNYLTYESTAKILKDEWKKEYSWLNDVPAQVLQQSLIDLYKAINNCNQYNKTYSKKIHPQFKSRNNNQGIRLPQPKKDCKLTKNRIIIPKLKTSIKVINSYQTTKTNKAHNTTTTSNNTKTSNNNKTSNSKLEHELYSGELRNITIIKDTKDDYYVSINCVLNSLLTEYDKESILKARKEFREQYNLEDKKELTIGLDPGKVNSLTSNYGLVFNTIPNKDTEPKLYAKYKKILSQILKLEQKKSKLLLKNYKIEINKLLQESITQTKTSNTNTNTNKTNTINNTTIFNKTTTPLTYLECKQLVKASRLWDSDELRKLQARINKKTTRLKNIRNDRIDKVTTGIIRTFDNIDIEDTKTSEMIVSAKGTLENPGKNVKHTTEFNKEFSEQSIGLIIRKLEYKSRKYGKSIIRVPAYNTSITCCECGNIDEKNRIVQSKFKCCECGYKEHADVNSSKNMNVKGNQLRSEVRKYLKNSENQTVPVKKKEETVKNKTNSVLRNAKEPKLAQDSLAVNMSNSSGKPR